jgi:hypothetical protein
VSEKQYRMAELVKLGNCAVSPLPFGFMPRENTIVALHGAEYVRLDIQHARDLLADLANEQFAACSCHRRAAIKRNAACLARAVNAYDARQLELAQMARNTKGGTTNAS